MIKLTLATLAATCTWAIGTTHDATADNYGCHGTPVAVAVVGCHVAAAPSCSGSHAVYVEHRVTRREARQARRAERRASRSCGGHYEVMAVPHYGCGG